MPVDNHKEPFSESPRSASARRRRRFLNRRNAIITTIGLATGLIALILVGLLAYRLGFVDRYVAGQIKNTLATYAVRAASAPAAVRPSIPVE